MRVCARGPSGMLTALTPALLQEADLFERLRRVAAFGREHFDGRHELAARDAPRPVRALFERDDLDVGRRQLDDARGLLRLTSARSACRRGETARTASEMSLMCAGVVPQQPPMNLTPAWISRFAYFAMYSGEHM